MTGLWVPPTVSHWLAERTRSFREDVYRSIDMSPDSLRDEFTAQLQRIDQRIIMVRANDRVVPGVPMRPGYYHLLQDGGLSVPLTITCIEGDRGEFVYPTSRVFERLHGGDMRERRNLERFAAVEREKQAAIEREQARDREERIEHRKDLVNAYTRTSISTTDATPWRQNQAGHDHGGTRRRGRKR